MAKIQLIDQDGYKYFLNFGNLQNTYKKIKNGKNSHLARFFCHNPYTKENIQLFLDKRPDDIELITSNLEDAHQNLDFFCKRHRYYFTNSWNVISRGVGCPLCCQEKIETAKQNKFEAKYKFYIPLLEKKHNIKILATEYSSITQEFAYICNKHPNLNQTTTWRKLLNNDYCCRECLREKAREQYIKVFLKRIESLYGDSICIKGKYINSNTPILIYCDKCKNTFYGKPYHLLEGHACPKCQMSIGERQIESWLKSNNINYKTQYKVEGCKNKKPLSYDFFIPDKNLLIEYQGIQHYQPVEVFGGEKIFKIQQKNDKIKKQFAIDNNYILLEIKYTDNVADKLSGVFGGGG